MLFTIYTLILSNKYTFMSSNSRHSAAGLTRRRGELHLCDLTSYCVPHNMQRPQSKYSMFSMLITLSTYEIKITAPGSFQHVNKQRELERDLMFSNVTEEETQQGQCILTTSLSEAIRCVWLMRSWQASACTRPCACTSYQNNVQTGE